MTAKQKAGRGAKPLVLLAEDEALIRIVLEEGLAWEGFEVLEARNGDEALAILASAAPLDLVITDVKMPGKTDGISVAKTAKKLYNLPAIVISGHYNERLAEDAVDAFLSKPFAIDKLVQTARRLIEEKREGVAA